MSLHHIGKVLALHTPKNTKSATATTQATLEMWDDNILTLTVDPKIARSVKDGDFVLVDYTPVAISSTNVMQKQLVTKIVKPESAKKIWESYKQYLQRQKRFAAATEARREQESGYLG